MKLKTLKEHNDEVYRLHNTTKNGIGCPSCGHELDDMQPMMLFLTSIPLCGIECFNCGYTGKRCVDKRK